ncbi:MAG: heparan-alpha-glucosaminide N-acetyltransferase [Acetanaerobacterium sp.]
MAQYSDARARLDKRVGLIDEIRGLSILLMVVYHLFFDLVYLYGLNIPAFHSPFLAFLQPLFAGVFIFISGVACRYSRNNLKRGALCFALGLGLTAVTLIFMPGERILFGILHFLGVAMMLYGLLHRVLDRLAPWVGALVMAALFALTYAVPQGRIGIAAFSAELPHALYATGFLFPLGLRGQGFFSADYFPILPWTFLFFAGAYIGVYFKQNRLPAWCYRTHLRPLAFVGRNTIWVYLAHQPVVYGLLYVVFYLIGR